MSIATISARPLLISLMAIACLGCGSSERAPDIAVEGGSPVRLYNVAVVYGGNTHSFGVIGEFGKEMAFGPIAAKDDLQIRWSEESPDNKTYILDFTDLLRDVDGAQIRKISFQYHGSGQWTGMLTAPDESVVSEMDKTLEDAAASASGE